MNPQENSWFCERQFAPPWSRYSKNLQNRS